MSNDAKKQELQELLKVGEEFVTQKKLKNGDFTGPCRAERLLDHAKSLGMTHLMIAYSAWDTYHSIYGKKSTPYYEKWLKKMAELVKARIQAVIDSNQLEN